MSVRLSNAHREFLLRQFACYSTPSEAVVVFERAFGFKIPSQTANYYDPHSSAGRRLAEKWRELFEVARKAFLDNAAEAAPIAQKSYRLRKYQLVADEMERRGNYMALVAVLEKAGREMEPRQRGVPFGSRAPADGGPSDGAYADLNDMTDEQLNAELAQLWHLAQAAAAAAEAQKKLEAPKGVLIEHDPQPQQR